MKATELRSFKTFLQDQKGALLNRSADFKSETVFNEKAVTDEAEIASTDLARNLSIQLHERERTMLQQIEKALGKIQEGKYGECESCGDEIGLKRLKARPFATICITCAEDQESASRPLN
jgi:DnaK suppressor protein